MVQSLLQSNVIVPAGTAQIGSTEYNVKLNSSPSTVDQFNAIPVKVVNGAPVLLRDVAHVRDGYAVQQNIVHIDGNRASYIVILKHSNAGTLAVVDGVKSLLPSIQAAAPEGITLKLDFDQSIFVRAALTNVLHEAVISSILVSLMILFFLGSFRSVAIVSSSIPLAILVGIAGLFAHREHPESDDPGRARPGHRHAGGRRDGRGGVHPPQPRSRASALTVAILDGAHEVATPALAATLTICIVFFPVVLLTGPARYLFTPLALAVVFSMLASYVLQPDPGPGAGAAPGVRARPRGDGGERAVRPLQPLARFAVRAVPVRVRPAPGGGAAPPAVDARRPSRWWSWSRRRSRSSRSGSTSSPTWTWG